MANNRKYSLASMYLECQVIILFLPISTLSISTIQVPGVALKCWKGRNKF